MFKKEYLALLCCPDCKGELFLRDKHLICKQCKRQYSVINDIPILLPLSMRNDIKLSQKKWDAEYIKNVNRKEALKLKKGFKNTYLESHMIYFRKLSKSSENKRYLEIGCGPFFMGQELAKLGAFVVGIDYSINALKLAKFSEFKTIMGMSRATKMEIQDFIQKDKISSMIFSDHKLEKFNESIFNKERLDF